MAWYLAEFGTYTGDRISPEDVEIPDRPSPDHSWQDGVWVLAFRYDWQGLKDAMRGTAFFSKAVGTSNYNAFSLLMATFDSGSPNESRLQDFVYAIGAIRAGLTADYTEQQLSNFRLLLQQFGFPVFL